MTAQDQNNKVADNSVTPVSTPNGVLVSGPSFDNPVSTDAVPQDPVSNPIATTSVSPVIPMAADPLNAPSDAALASSTPVVNEMTAPKENIVTSASSNADTTNVVPATSDDNSAKKDMDDKDSPLESLAKKLAQLKSEFIQDEPDDKDKPKDAEPVKEEKKEDTKENLQDLPTEAAMPQAKDLPPIIGNDIPQDLKEKIVMPPVNPVELSQPGIDTQQATAPLVTAADAPSAEPAKPNLVAPMVEEKAKTDTNVVADISLNSGIPSVSQPSSPAVDTTVATAPQDALAKSNDSSAVEDILKQYETELYSSPQNPDAPVNQASDTNAQSVEPTLEVPVSTTTMPAQSSSATGADQLLNEGDNSEVGEKDVELLSNNSKYPVSINKILDEAIERNASDVLISVGYPVMLRVDSVLIAVNNYIVSPTNSKELILPVLTEQKKELLEVNREVDLAYTHRHNGEARFRINAFFSQDNLSAAFRLIPTRIRTIEELNLPPILNQFTNLKQGLVLVTGPTGHGKSTTLAAMLQAINTNKSTHILTIEDPIEYIFPKSKSVVDQREMHDDTHSWDIALKSALRQDPDVILVGEMRDYETISSTITLAETGHLVFATLHTNSAAQTIDRIIDVFPENQQAQVRSQLATILQAVISQRLIPIEGGGRRAVCEIMLGTAAVNNLIREGKTHQLDNVIRTSADVGMNALENSLVALVRDGLITVDKAQEYSVHPEEIIRLLKS